MSHLGNLLSSSSPKEMIWPAIFILATFAIVHKVYTIAIHPLNKFPGPLLCAITNLPYSIWFSKDRKEFVIYALHEKYGPVVRIAPNELSFNTAQSWKDIYGFRTGHQTFIKSEFYDGGSFSGRGVKGIVSSRDPKEHAHMRRYLSHAFSEQALKDQEVLIHEIVDLLIQQLREQGVDKSGQIDFEKWLRMCTFDITGSLVFGRSFDAVKNGGQHPSIRFVHEALTQLKVVDTMKRFPAVGKLFALFFARTMMKLVHGNAVHEAFCLKVIRDRLSNPSSRPDFLTRLQNVQNEESDKSLDLQLAAHCSELITAGSDTSNTTLCTVLNFVLRDQSLYKRLCDEVRNRFLTYGDIDSHGASSISFIRLLILEALRILPPVPLGLPRIVPPGGDTVDGDFVPGGTIVSTNPVAASLSEKNFTLPMEYRPERWEKGNLDYSSDILEASQPFSLGPRGCIGQNLAWKEMHLIICKLIWSFNLELENRDRDVHRDAKTNTLWNSPPLYIKVTERRA